MTAITTIVAEAKKIQKKYPKKDWKDCIKQASAIYRSKHKKKKISGVKKKALNKKGSYHKDTKSHNVRISVVSGTPKEKAAKKSIKKVLKKAGYRLPHGYDLKKGNVRSLSGMIYGIVTGSKYSKLAQNLIIDNIDSSGYGKNLKTEIEKVKFLKETFLSEYGWAVSRMGMQNAVESWLRGLPSSLTLPFYNDEIIRLAKQWGSLPQNATEKQEDKILNNYWRLMAANVVKLFNKVK